jgi:hypothetical protein
MCNTFATCARCHALLEEAGQIYDRVDGRYRIVCGDRFACAVRQQAIQTLEEPFYAPLSRQPQAAADHGRVDA